MSLFQLGDFLLNSGKRSDWRLDCDALTQNDWRALAKLITKVVPPFGTVEGIPRGGIYLAEQLIPYLTEGCPVHLIVDDVLTTGGSMERAKMRYCLNTYGLNVPYPGVTTNCVGVVLFARGPCPFWIKPLFQLPKELWL